ncbi:hypothetical protein VNI00_006947 [Paramarasmius palmivorus]|uniref:Uncharacterized protein n=1 Tax=Paramarasmius palmivorus TaxID=297713 RepID=A0AAW0D0I5_9AGAR
MSVLTLSSPKHFNKFSAAERIFNDPGSWGLEARKEWVPNSSLNDSDDDIYDIYAAGPSQTPPRKNETQRSGDGSRKRKSKPPAFKLKPFTHKHHLMPINDASLPTSDSSSSDSLFDSPDPKSTPESSDSEKVEDSDEGSLVVTKSRTKWAGVPEDVGLDQHQSLAQLLESSTSITAELFEQRMSILWSQGNIFRAFPTPKDVDFGDDLISPETGIATSSFIVSSPKGQHSLTTSSSRVAIRSSRSSSLKIPLRISTTTTTTTKTVISVNTPSPVSVTVITGSSSAYSIFELYGASPYSDGFTPAEKSKLPKTSLPNHTMFEAISHPPLPNSKSILAPKTSHPTTTTFQTSSRPPFSPHTSFTAMFSAKFTRTTFLSEGEMMPPPKSSSQIVELPESVSVSVPRPKKEPPALRIETSVPSRLELKSRLVKEVGPTVSSKKSTGGMKSPGIRPLPQPPRSITPPPPVPSLPRLAKAGAVSVPPPVPSLPSVAKETASQFKGTASSISAVPASRIPTRKPSARLRSRSPPRAAPDIPLPRPSVGTTVETRQSRTTKATDKSRLRSTTPPPRGSRAPKKLPPVPKLPDLGVATASTADESRSPSQPDEKMSTSSAVSASTEEHSSPSIQSSDGHALSQSLSEVMALLSQSPLPSHPSSPHQMVVPEAAGTPTPEVPEVPTAEPILPKVPAVDKPAVAAPLNVSTSELACDLPSSKLPALLEVIPPTPIVPPVPNVLVAKENVSPGPSLPIAGVAEANTTLRPVHKRSPSSGRLSATDVPNPDASILALRSRRRTASFAAGTSSSRLSDAVRLTASQQVNADVPNDKLSSKLLSPSRESGRVMSPSRIESPSRGRDEQPVVSQVVPTDIDAPETRKALRHARSAGMLVPPGDASKVLKSSPSVESLFDHDAAVSNHSLSAKRTVKKMPSTEGLSVDQVSAVVTTKDAKGPSAWKPPLTWNVARSPNFSLPPIIPLRSPQRPKQNEDLPMQTLDLSAPDSKLSPHPSPTHKPAFSIEQFSQADASASSRVSAGAQPSVSKTPKSDSAGSLDELPEDVVAALTRLGVRRRPSQKPTSNSSERSSTDASASDKTASLDTPKRTSAENADSAASNGAQPKTHTPASSVEKLPESTISSLAKRERRRAPTPTPSDRIPLPSDIPLPPLPPSHRGSPSHTPKASVDKPPGFDIALAKMKRPPTPVLSSKTDVMTDVSLPPLPAGVAVTKVKPHSTRSPNVSIDGQTREYRRAPTPTHSRSPSALSDLPIPPVPIPDASILQRRRKPSISRSERPSFSGVESESRRFAQPTMSSAAKSISKRTSVVPAPIDTSTISNSRGYAMTPSRSRSVAAGLSERRVPSDLPPPLPPKDERRGRAPVRTSSPSRDRGRSVDRSVAASDRSETFAAKSARSRSVGPSREGEVLTRTRKRTSSLSAGAPPLPSASLASSPVPPIPSPHIRGRVSPFPMARSASRPPSRALTDRGAF